jgi:hypothetical protein
MPVKKFTPIKIKSDQPDTIFQTYKLELAKAIIAAIDYAVKYKRKRVEFANIIVRGMLVITLSVDYREFIDLLEKNIEYLIEFEEYEDCALAVKLKEKLSKLEY